MITQVAQLGGPISRCRSAKV